VLFSWLGLSHVARHSEQRCVDTVLTCTIKHLPHAVRGAPNRPRRSLARCVSQRKR
jgi:hypothetical protein